MIKVRYPPHRYFAENSKIVKKASTVKCNIYKTTDYPRFLGAFFKHFNTARLDLEQREKIISNFYFLNFLWCLKRYYEGL